MITTILWDVDATLLDFLAAEKAAIKKTVSGVALGECTDEMIRRYSKINRSYWERLECGELTKPEVLVGRFREFLRRRGSAAMWRRRLMTAISYVWEIPSCFGMTVMKS